MKCRGYVVEGDTTDTGDGLRDSGGGDEFIVLETSSLIRLGGEVLSSSSDFSGEDTTEIVSDLRLPSSTINLIFGESALSSSDELELASVFESCGSSRFSFVPNSSVIATAAMMAMRSALFG